MDQSFLTVPPNSCAFPPMPLDTLSPDSVISTERFGRQSDVRVVNQLSDRRQSSFSFVEADLDGQSLAALVALFR